MLLIQCPWCGSRDQTEFSYHGEAHLKRAQDPQQLSEPQWGDYVFFRTNAKGLHYERWRHSHGCRRWFNAIRDTRSDRLHTTYPPEQPPPDRQEFESEPCGK